jgi:peroxiredoxin
MSDRPVEKKLNEVAAGAKQKAPDVARTFEEGVAEVASRGIVAKAPKVGDKAELFALADASGTTVTLEALLKKGPVVLTWYRGGWCPYCNIALRGLLEVEPQIHALGATLVALSPETPENVEKTSKADALTFEVLSDKGNGVARAYRIVYKLPEKTSALMKGFKLDLAKRNGDGSDELPLAATFVVDTDRTIRWAFVDADYRKRAEPADVVEALKKLKR